MVVQDFYRQSRDTVIAELKVSATKGLSRSEVLKRRRTHGLNQVKRTKPKSAIIIFFERFRDPLVIFLIAAALASLLIGELFDAIIITAVIVIDAILSYIQVWRASQTLKKLRQSVRHHATVTRSGKTGKVLHKDLVPGDIIEITAGEKVPADARLLEVSGLRAREAALTGESADVTKQAKTIKERVPLGDRANMVYSGTVITSGTAKAVVTATGKKTEIGRIAQILESEKSPDSPLRRKLASTSIIIGVITVALVVIISGVNYLLGQTAIESIRIAITLIVSAVPEDMTIILTIALMVGVIRILRQKGVVKDLSSAETLGAATVICTDKTGTLTQGIMQGEEFDTLSGEKSVHSHLTDLGIIGYTLATAAHRASTDSGSEYVGSATESSALEFSEKSGFIQLELRDQWRQKASIAFDPTWKYRASLNDHPTNHTQTLFVTGAPDILLEASSKSLDENGDETELTSKKRTQILKRTQIHASSGKRLLGVAVRRNLEQSKLDKTDIKDLTFIGVLTIKDPIRPEVVQSIQEAISAGVSVKIVTGDYSATASSVARQLGLSITDETTIDGAELASIESRELDSVIASTNIFARVTPIDKQLIVKSLRSQGHIVAMTGDGVNDAVSLKSADIGVAMGSGKDIAKDAADLILLDNNFRTIVSAIKEGRTIRDNVRKVIAFLLATNLTEVFIFTFSIIMGLPLPLIPGQILWINLVTDGTSDIALSFEKSEANVMQRRPENPNAHILNRRTVQHIVVSGTIISIFAASLLMYLHSQSLELNYIRTMIFTFIVIVSTLSMWTYRSLSQTMWRRGLWQNPWLFASAGLSIALQLAVLYTPFMQKLFTTVALSANDWLILTIMSVSAVLLMDMRKLFIKE